MPSPLTVFLDGRVYVRVRGDRTARRRARLLRDRLRARGEAQRGRVTIGRVLFDG